MPLPLVEKGDVAALRANCARLLQALEASGAPLPVATQQGLRAALQPEVQDSAARERIQQLLDPYCLIGVNINPESRVKATRGPAEAHLVQLQDTVVLIKVHNEAGVTQRLTLTSPHLVDADGNAGEERWLAASIHHNPPMPEKLTGHELEYLLLVLSSRVAGKREARLVFDVGQGTQDLGFRAEVPVLFTIKARKP
jgi:hypothetical protein